MERLGETVVPITVDKSRALKKWLKPAHACVAALHGLVLIGLVSLRASTRSKVSVHLLEETFQHMDPSRKCECQPSASLETLGTKVNVFALCVVFSSAVIFAHAFYATDGFGSNLYTHFVANGKNPFRWCEFSITATSMMLVMAILSGVRQRVQLVVMCLASVGTMVQGYSIEAAIAGGLGALDRIFPLVAGWALFAATWYPILYSWYERLDHVAQFDNKCKSVDAYDEKTQPPRWIETLVLSMFVLFAYFGLVSLGHVIHSFRLEGDPATMRDRFIFYEFFYMALSLVVKTMLNIWAMAAIFADEDGLVWLRGRAAADGNQCVSYRI
ncbi:hypothetical protein CTAYLR_008750 [Chrysophaeum taylorii]|uniref:Uncharacterized protein n=1 Tax=Chrysophaeum taylorii TaxID=2483200 RepID=A0AAD7UEW6_9STRA|nr:hypothetical protein CTAYLR_008750 [Chrysophaeum taylorii]